EREAPMESAYDGRQVVGMDVHRRRSVLVRMTEDGQRLGTVGITNTPEALRREIARAGKFPRVGLEATYGWYWAADTLAAAGAEGRGGAPGAPLGGEGVHLRASQKRPEGRRGPGGSAAEGRVAGGVDRPAADPGAAGAHPVPGQAGGPADQLQGPGPRRAGQA